jgi:hypothetical protein
MRREARHQRDLDTETSQIGELEVEEAEVPALEHRRQRLHLRAEARGHAAGEHDGGNLAALDRFAPARRGARSLRRSRRGQAPRHVLRRYLDRLADAVQRLGVGGSGDQARPELVEGDAVEAEAREQLRQLRRDRGAGDLHHGSP